MRIDSLNQSYTSKYLKKRVAVNKQSKLQRNPQYNIVYEDKKLENNTREKLSISWKRIRI